jgi:intracellular multiplication protein IcmC
MMRIKFKLLSIILTSFFIFSTQAYAAAAPDIATMLINFSEAVPNLMRLVTALAYVMGIFFIITGIIELKHFGESRSMMSQEHSLAKPLIALTVGTMLLYLPASVQTGLSTFWVTPNPYGYLPSSSDGSNWMDLSSAVFMVIQLVGTIAFIRGLLMMRHVAGHGQPDTFAKAVAHIVAGILCINLYQFLQVIFDTLGITGVIPPF